MAEVDGNGVGSNMRASKVDANQPEIVLALRHAGATVQHLHKVGEGCPDILCGYHGINLLMEIKDGDKPPSERKLTPDQVEWHESWRGQKVVVSSAEEAIEALKAEKQRIAEIMTGCQ